MKFYASISIDVRKGEAIKNGNDIVGNKVTVKVVKNKVAPPFKVALVEIMYGEGVSRIGELIDLSVEHEVVQKSGAWFAYKGEKIGQGKEAVRAFLKSNPVLEAEITEEVKKKAFFKQEESLK